MGNKQTAVEFLIDKINHNDFVRAFETEEWLKIFQQAKQMEEEQTKQFAQLCLDKALDLDIRTAHSNIEQYYNEQYSNKRT